MRRPTLLAALLSLASLASLYSAAHAQAPRVAAMTALLQREMKDYGDDTPLTVANPRPAAWTPPAPSQIPADASAADKVQGKAAKKF